jgi:hypothetical protein
MHVCEEQRKEQQYLICLNLYYDALLHEKYFIQPFWTVRKHIERSKHYKVLSKTLCYR